jgi:hypothetical protein
MDGVHYEHGGREVHMRKKPSAKPAA